MAGFWRLYRYRRKDGYCYIGYQKIFYLYVFSYDGLSCDILSIYSLLDEHQKLYTKLQAESP